MEHRTKKLQNVARRSAAGIGLITCVGLGILSAEKIGGHWMQAEGNYATAVAHHANAVDEAGSLSELESFPTEDEYGAFPLYGGETNEFEEDVEKLKEILPKNSTMASAAALEELAAAESADGRGDRNMWGVGIWVFITAAMATGAWRTGKRAVVPTPPRPDVTKGKTPRR